MTDRQLMQQAFVALNMLTSDQPKDKMNFSEIMQLMIALRERLERNDEEEPFDPIQMGWVDRYGRP